MAPKKRLGKHTSPTGLHPIPELLSAPNRRPVGPGGPDSSELLIYHVLPPAPGLLGEKAGCSGESYPQLPCVLTPIIPGLILEERTQSTEGPFSWGLLLGASCIFGQRRNRQAKAGWPVVVRVRADGEGSQG